MHAWALRRQGTDRFPSRLQRRRLYILPTRAGIGFGVLVLGMLIAALNYGNGTALWLAGLFAGLALIAMHQCHRNLLGLQITSASTRPAFAGGHGTVSLLLTNDSRLARYGVEVSETRVSASLDLPPNAAHRVDLDVPTHRRGLMRVERLRLSTTQPFGLFRAWTWVHAPLAIVVFPRPRGNRSPPLDDGPRHGVSRSPGGDDRDEWRSLRTFREGDSPRQVAWKAYARGAPLLVKEYAASGAEQRVFDFSRLVDLDTEARLEQLARWIVDSEARGERYGLRLPGAALAPDSGPDHRHRALTALALQGIERL
ncbi:MAG: DUF58 domain-containing protein [Steroidobacteraceae bacterium]